MVKLPPEHLGSFYLGAHYDLNSKTISSEAVNYDARDLTTHAVCVGMTGSGKTGLCISLLEEAAMDQVPAIIIDPKGDMTNLMLQFENLAPSDFEKWINADDATRKGMSLSDYAAATAEKWKKGLAEWGQGTARIKALKNSVDYTIYTPGSDSGIPINIMGSFAAPEVDFDSDAEMLRERIQGTVAALLGMINSKANPVRSREGILLSNLFEHYWRKNQDLDLAVIIRAIQQPPFKQLGVFDLDTFFPPDDRFDLAMDFNSLMASPQFRYWLQGEPLDIDKIYFTAEGKPRHSIFYIAHLSENERMFFVTLLLNSLLSWMRKQSGTTSLRSLVYFDEIFGYFPPTAKPPSKKPLMTILKQARAYGLGAILVTQNPVDIDYRGLSNAGTWFIGKLQTDRDKERVLDGLKGAIAQAGASSQKNFSKIISSLSSRVFLMHNVHDEEPVVFHTRWAMSYLRGPLTRPQLKELMSSKKTSSSTPISSNTITKKTKTSKRAVVATPPSVDPAIDQRFFIVRKSIAQAKVDLAVEGNLSLEYEPGTLATAKIRFYDAKKGIDVVKEIAYLAAAPDDFGRTDWAAAQQVQNWEYSLKSAPTHPDGLRVQYEAVPDALNTAKELAKVKKEFANWLYQTQEFPVLSHEKLKLSKSPSESDEAFLMRVKQKTRELRDEEMDKLQEKYEAKLDKLTDRIRREENRLEEREEEVQSRNAAQWIGVAETVFSVFMGRRRRSLSSVTSKNRMKRRAAQKLRASEEELQELQADFDSLEQELQEKLEELKTKWEQIAEAVTIKKIKPRRADVKVDTVMLVWQAYWVAENGERVSALV